MDQPRGGSGVVMRCQWSDDAVELAGWTNDKVEVAKAGAVDWCDGGVAESVA